MIIRSRGARSGLVTRTSHLGRGHDCARTKARDGLVAGGITVACAERVDRRRRRLHAVRGRPGAAARARQSAEHLYAVNTPDDRLEIFKVQGRTPVAVGFGRGGHAPVAVALRNDSEVWVVNHLSDSVSIVDVSDPRRPRVVRTLLVGDEPRDIVFAGPEPQPRVHHHGAPRPERARSIRSSRRRASAAPTSGCSTPATSATSLGGHAAHHHHAVRRHAARARGERPTAARSTPRRSTPATAPRSSTERVDRRLAASRSGSPAETNAAGDPAPERRPDRQVQRRATGSTSSASAGTQLVSFTLPDNDVFAIDADGRTRRRSSPAPAATFAASAPCSSTWWSTRVNGKVYVTQHRGAQRHALRGARRLRRRNTTVRGHLAREPHHRARRRGVVTPRHLNKHIDYAAAARAPATPRARKSLAFPLDMAVTSDGATLYVAAFGSSKVGVFDTAELENDTLRAERARPDRAQRRRPDRPRARRGARAASTC